MEIWLKYSLKTDYIWEFWYLFIVILIQHYTLTRYKIAPGINEKIKYTDDIEKLGIYQNKIFTFSKRFLSIPSEEYSFQFTVLFF